VISSSAASRINEITSFVPLLDAVEAVLGTLTGVPSGSRRSCSRILPSVVHGVRPNRLDNGPESEDLLEKEQIDRVRLLTYDADQLFARTDVRSRG
jgi:hypothetical protein